MWNEQILLSQRATCLNKSNFSCMTCSKVYLDLSSYTIFNTVVFRTFPTDKLNFSWPNSSNSGLWRRFNRNINIESVRVGECSEGSRSWTERFKQFFSLCKTRLQAAEESFHPLSNENKFRY